MVHISLMRRLKNLQISSTLVEIALDASIIIDLGIVPEHLVGSTKHHIVPGSQARYV